MKMKKVLSVFLLATILIGVIPAIPSVAASVNGTYELFRDPTLSNGVTAHSIDYVATGTNRDLTIPSASGAPIWTLAEWSNRYDFTHRSETTYSNPSANVYVYETADKRVTFDQNDDSVSLYLKASQVYNAPRRDGEDWPALILEHSIVDNIYAYRPEKTLIKNMNALRLRLSTELTEYENFMTSSQYDSGLHTAQFCVYLYVTGFRANGSGEMMWFGANLFDSRYTSMPEWYKKDEGFDGASGLMIYNIPSGAYDYNSFHDESGNVVTTNGRLNMDMDVLPYIKRALTIAHQNGYMMGIDINDCFVSGFNIGWEIPGTFDAEMKIRDLSLTSYTGDAVYDPAVFYSGDVTTDTVRPIDDLLTISYPASLFSQGSTDAIDFHITDTTSAPVEVRSSTYPQSATICRDYTMTLKKNGNPEKYLYNDDVTFRFDATKLSAFTKDGGCKSTVHIYRIDAGGTCRELLPVFDTTNFTMNVTTNINSTIRVAVTHHQTSSWQSDEAGHWHICSKCRERVDDGKHELNSSGVCKTCSYVCDHLLGDLNGNFKIESNDAALVRTAYLSADAEQTAAYLPTGDVNGNAKLDSNDYILIRMKVLGLIDEFPA